VVHDGFAPGSVVLPDISDGWPRVLAGLKTLLETGETLPAGQAVGPERPRLYPRFSGDRRGQFLPVGGGWSR
jgi:hypothetical protein